MVRSSYFENRTNGFGSEIQTGRHTLSAWLLQIQGTLTSQELPLAPSESPRTRIFWSSPFDLRFASISRYPLISSLNPFKRATGASRIILSISLYSFLFLSLSTFVFFFFLKPFCHFQLLLKYFRVRLLMRFMRILVVFCWIPDIFAGMYEFA